MSTLHEKIRPHQTQAAQTSRRSWPFGGVFVIAFWLVMMLLLWRREGNYTSGDEPNLLDLQAIAAKWHDTSEYALLTMGGNPVGALVTTMTRQLTTPPSYQLEAITAARLGPAGVVAFWVALAARLDERLALDSFWVTGTLPTAKFSLAGKVEFPDFFIEVRTGTNVQRGRFRLDKPIVLADAFRSVLLRSDVIVPGKKFSLLAVDPLWNLRLGRVDLQIGDAEEIVVRGQKQLAYRVTTRWGDVSSLGWIDAAGRLVRQQILGTLALERATPGEVEPFLSADTKISPPQDLNREEFLHLPPQPLTQQALLSLGLAPPVAESLPERAN
ncbi:MAG: hypothetical protein ACPL7D_10080 [Candidatus Sumerlaeaceae bacterium]